MKFRFNRELLDESMETMIDIPPTIEAIQDAMRSAYGKLFKHIKGQIKVEPYGYDDRIGWDTYIVFIDGYGVIGFTDGPTNSE